VRIGTKGRKKRKESNCLDHDEGYEEEKRSEWNQVG
jgi:hypothetical protein